MSLAGAVVRLIIRLRADQQTGFREREVQTALGEASSVVVVREVETEARARLGDLSPEALTPIQLVDIFFQTRQDEPERRQALLGKAEELMRDTG
jgi:hypothetical protein